MISMLDGWTLSVVVEVMKNGVTTQALVAAASSTVCHVVQGMEGRMERGASDWMQDTDSVVVIMWVPKNRW